MPSANRQLAFLTVFFAALLFFGIIILNNMANPQNLWPGAVSSAPAWAVDEKNALAGYANLAKNNISGGTGEDSARYLDYYLITGDSSFLTKIKSIADTEWGQPYNGGGCHKNAGDGKSEQMGTHFTAPQGSVVIATQGQDPKYLNRIDLTQNLIVSKWLKTNSTGHTHFASYWNTCTQSISTDSTLPGQHFDADIPNTGVLAKLAILPLFFQTNSAALTKMAAWAHSWSLDLLRTDSGKPAGLTPPEVRFSDDSFSAWTDLKWNTGSNSCTSLGTKTWYNMSGDISWACDWDYRRYVLVMDYLHAQLFALDYLSPDPTFLQAQRAELEYYFKTAAVNGLPPAVMDANGQWQDVALLSQSAPPVDWYLAYRQLSGDTSLDQTLRNGFVATLDSVYTTQGGNPYARIFRSSLAPDTSFKKASLDNGAYLAWVLTGDKKWIERAFTGQAAKSADYLANGSHAFAYAYLGATLRGYPNGFEPLMAVSWSNVDTNYAALVTNHDKSHLKILMYNFDASPQNAKLTLWELGPGTYHFRRGEDANGDDQMETVTEDKTLTVSSARPTIDLSLPAGTLQVLEIGDYGTPGTPTPSPTIRPSASPSLSPSPTGTNPPSTCPDASKVYCFDCNGDRIINVLDFTCFIDHYNQQYTK